MIKIITKKEGGKVTLGISFDTLPIKEFSKKTAELIRANGLKLRIIWRILKANPQKIFLEENKKESQLFLSWENKPQRKAFGFLRGKPRKETVHYFWKNLTRIIAKKIKINKEKIAQVTALIVSLALIFQLSVFLIPSTKANENGLCAFAVDAVLAIDTTGSMDGGDKSSKCEWENLEKVPTDFAPYYTYMCVSHQESGLTEQEWQAKDDGAPQCDRPIYTPPVPKKIDAAKEAAKYFINNLGENDYSLKIVIVFNWILIGKYCFSFRIRRNLSK